MSLTLESLLATLQATQSTSADRKLAENTLKAWENEPLFLLYLQTIYLDPSVPLTIRLLSVIQLKNGVVRQWRNRRSESDIVEKKEVIANCFRSIDEDNVQLMLQNAYVISRIARYEYSKLWPQIFGQLAELISQHDRPVCVHNGLLILNQLIKVLSLVKIGATAKKMLEDLERLAPVLAATYERFFDENTESVAFRICYGVLKVVRRATPFTSPNALDSLHERSLAYFSALLKSPNLGPQGLKFLRGFAKVFYDTTKTNPLAFVLINLLIQILETLFSVVQNSVRLVHDAPEDPDDATGTYVFLSIRTLLIFCQLFKTNAKGETVVLKHVASASAAKEKLASFVTPGLVGSVSELVLTWHVPMRTAELQSWSEDPEEFAARDLGESWDVDIRACAEHFIETTLQSYPNVLTPMIVEKAQKPTDAVIETDAVLAAVQLGAYALKDVLVFDDFFESNLVPMVMSAQEDARRVLLRRACFVIALWVGVSCSRETRRKIYALLVSFLNDSDMVIRLSSAHALRTCLEDWDYEKADFKEHAPGALDSLARLVGELELLQSKVYILQCIGILLDHSVGCIDETRLIALRDGIPQMWAHFASSEDYAMAQNILVRMLGSLIKCADNSSEYSEVVLDLVRACCTQDSPHYGSLSEDGFDLWLVYLECYPENKDPRVPLSVLELVYEPLLSTTELQALLLLIVKLYACITPLEIIVGEPAVRGVFERVLGAVGSNMSAMRDDSLDMLLTVVDLLWLKAYSYYTPGEVVDNSNNPIVAQFMDMMMSSDFLWETIRVAAEEDEHSLTTVSKLVLVGSRFFYANSRVISNVLEGWFSKNPGFFDVFKRFLNVWFLKLDLFYEKRKKKENLLGLSLVLLIEGKAREAVLSRENVNLLFSMWSVFLDETSEQNGDCKAYYSAFNYYDFDVMVTNNMELQGDEADKYRVHESWEFKRYKKIVGLDPVHTVDFKGYVRGVLTVLEHKVGGAWNEIMSWVDEGFKEAVFGVSM